MLYSLCISLLMICGVLSVDRVTFSTSDNFDDECNSPTSLSSVEPSDPLNDILYYCIYNDALAPGVYYRRFYDSSGNQVYSGGAFTISGSSNYELRRVYDKEFKYIATYQDTYTFRFESDDGSVVGVSGDIYINVRTEVMSVSVRVDAPGSSLSDYYPDVDGMINDGETLSVDNLEDSVYFVSMYQFAKEGQSFEIQVEGEQSGVVKTSSSSIADKDSTLKGKSYSRDLDDFVNDERLIITSYIYDSNGLVDAQQMVVSLESNSVPSPPIVEDSTVDSIIVRLSAPNGFDDYRPNAGDAINDGETVSYSSNDISPWFCAIYSNVLANQERQIIVRGDQSNVERQSDMKVIDSNASESGYCYSTSLGWFDEDSSLTIESILYDSSGNALHSDSISVNLIQSIASCKEKEGEVKPKCYNKSTQEKCEGYSDKCEWV